MPEPLTKVVVSLPGADAYLPRLRARFPDLNIELAVGDGLVTAIVDADALVCWNLSEEDLAAARRLKWVHRAAAGVEDLLTPAFRARELLLTNSSGVHAPNIAEHVLAMMLAFARGLPALLDAQRRHKWRDEATRRDVFELGGQRVLLVGYGAIGRAVAEKTRSLGMEPVAFRRTVDATAGENSVEQAPVNDLVALLPDADHVVNSLPETPSTRGLFDAGMFAAMQAGAHYYSVGRGTTTVTADLLAALEGGRLAGAGLDVTDPEPLPADSPLWDRPDVIITAHTSGATPHMWDRVFTLVEDNIDRFQTGRPMRNLVDQERGY